MLKGYRRIIAAIVGFVVAVLVFGTALAWVLWPGIPDLPSYNWKRTATSDYQPGGGSCQPSAINRLRTDTERASKRESCEEAAEQHRLQINDLIQQTRAADAAAQGVWVAYWQSKATVFGLIVGFFTLAAAAAAAIFAKQAADETRRGAIAAEGALKVTKDLAAAELRPWITIDANILKIEATDIAVRVDYEATFTNVGDTVATDVNIGFKQDFFGPKAADAILSYYEIEASKRGEHRLSLLPGEGITLMGSHRQKLRKIPWLEGESPHAYSVIVATVSYRSSLDEEWHRTDRGYVFGAKSDYLFTQRLMFRDQLNVPVGELVKNPFVPGEST